MCSGGYLRGSMRARARMVVLKQLACPIYQQPELSYHLNIIYSRDGSQIDVHVYCRGAICQEKNVWINRPLHTAYLTLIAQLLKNRQG